MRRWLGVFAATLIALGAVEAQAAVVTYRYTGNTLMLVDPLVPGVSETEPGFAGIMRIDESLLPGGTLLNATVLFVAFPGFGLDALDTPLGLLDPSSEVDGLLAFDVFPFPGVAGSELSFSTDANRNIIFWSGGFADGPPDGGSGNTGDAFFVDGVNYFAPPGTWSVIPLPAGGVLLLTALGALAGLAGRRGASLRG